MPTLTTYRQRSARSLGIYESGTATSGSTTSLLEALAWPFKSTLSQNDLFRDCYLFRPVANAAADKVRVVDIYTPSSGTIAPDFAWTNSPYAAGVGESFELHGVIEPLTALNDIVNEVLKRLLLVVEFTLTPTVNNIRHSLSTVASWLTDPRWVRQVGYLATGENRDRINPYGRPVRGMAVKDGGTVYLEHPNMTFNATDTLYVRAIKPAYFHCKPSAGAYGDQSGLSLETDAALPLEEWLAAGVLVEAWQRHKRLMDQTTNQRLVHDEAEAALLFTRLTQENYTEPELTFKPLRQFGPSIFSSGLQAR